MGYRDERYRELQWIYEIVRTKIELMSQTYDPEWGAPTPALAELGHRDDDIEAEVSGAPDEEAHAAEPVAVEADAWHRGDTW